MSDHESVDTPSLPPPGEIIAGKWEVMGVIGEGGMGAVLSAKHKILGEVVAIKVLSSEALKHPEAIERFIREAKASVAIKTEHVARVTDVGTMSTGAPFIVMEHLEGMDLQDLLDEQGAVPVETAVDYVLQACEAIAEAHHRKIVHRDLKPSNLFLTHRVDGSELVKVLDFGIAKALDSGDTRLTATGSALGTPIYMSPEQVRNAKDSDQRTDIWGLGTILYHLLAGNPPYDADTVPALCAMIIADPYPHLRDDMPSIPEALDEVVSRALEKKREDRFQSVAQFADALAPFAPTRSLVHVERVLNIASGGRASISGRFSLTDIAPDSMADTVASQPGKQLVLTADDDASKLTPGDAAKAHTQQDDSLNQTAGAWGAENKTSSRPMTFAAVAAAVVISGGIYFTMSGGDESTPTNAATPSVDPAAAAAPSPQPRVAAQPTSSPTSVAKPTATPTAEPSAKPIAPGPGVAVRPASRPAPRPAPAAEPNPEPKPQPKPQPVIRPKPKPDVLSDRK